MPPVSLYRQRARIPPRLIENSGQRALRRASDVIEPDGKGRRLVAHPILPRTERQAYLQALRDTKSPKKALVAIGRVGYSLDQSRRDRDFRTTEKTILGYIPLKARPYEYLAVLRKRLGNVSAALRAAHAERMILDVWREDPWFMHAENRVFDEIRGLAEEENVKVAIGRKPKNKDSAHLRWFLAHIDKERWGDTRTIEHQISGHLDVKTIDDEILELTSGSD